MTFYQLPGDKQAGAPQVAGPGQPIAQIDQERLQLAAAQKVIESLKVLLDAGPGGKHQ